MQKSQKNQRKSKDQKKGSNQEKEINNANGNMLSLPSLSISLPDKFPHSSILTHSSSTNNSSNSNNRHRHSRDGKRLSKSSNIENQSKIYYAGAAFDRSPAPNTLPKPNYKASDEEFFQQNFNIITSSSSAEDYEDEDDGIFSSSSDSNRPSFPSLNKSFPSQKMAFQLKLNDFKDSLIIDGKPSSLPSSFPIFSFQNDGKEEIESPLAIIKIRKEMKIQEKYENFMQKGKNLTNPKSFKHENMQKSRENFIIFNSDDTDDRNQSYNTATSSNESSSLLESSDSESKSQKRSIKLKQILGISSRNENGNRNEKSRKIPLSPEISFNHQNQNFSHYTNTPHSPIERDSISTEEGLKQLLGIQWKNEKLKESKLSKQSRKENVTLSEMSLDLKRSLNIP